jgi:acetolactate synthase-1/2/3 large subunit
VAVPIVGDVKNILAELNKLINTREHGAWLDQIGNWRKEHPMTNIRECEELLPQFVIRKIYEVTRGEATIVTGVGQHQMWAAQHYWYDRPNSLITSGGLGTMGFEIPAAIGAKVGRPDDIVWCIAGDGGFQMKMQELGTIVQENLAVKIAIIDNGCLGLPRQWQELLYHKNYVCAYMGGPDYVKLADAYGIPARRVTRQEEVVPAVKEAMAYPGPFIIDFKVNPDENVYPFVPPGKALAECIEEPRKELVWPRLSTP